MEAVPLIKSKSNAARSKNIAAEIRAGRDPKQAAAIAYSIQRHAGHKSTPKHHGPPSGNGEAER